MEDKKMTREEFQKLIDQTLDEGMEEAVAWEMKKRDPIYDAMKDTYMEAFPTLSEKEAYETYMTLIQMRLEREEEARQAVFEETGIPPQEQRDREMMDKYGRKYINIPPLQDDIDMLNKHIIEKQKKDQELLDKLLKDDPDTNDNDSKPEEERNTPENNDGDNNDNENNNSSNNWKWIALFAIFLLGIGGCFGGLIMKGSKDAAESAYGQENNNENKKEVEVKISNPIEEDKSGNNTTEYLLDKLDKYVDDPAEVENVKAAKPDFKKLYKGEKEDDILEEKDLPNHMDPKFDGKLFARYKGFLYKKTSPEHAPHEDTGEVEWYTDLETFYKDKKEFYGTVLKKMGGEYCEAVKAIQVVDIGVVPYHHITDKDPKDFTITAQVNMLDVDYEYRSRLDEIAMLRKMFYVFRYILVDQSGNEEIVNGINPYDPKYRNIETYSGCQYKDTYWNQSGPKYHLKDFDPSYMNGYVKDILQRWN